jgi:hypothetical protein
VKSACPWSSDPKTALVYSLIARSSPRQVFSRPATRPTRYRGLRLARGLRHRRPVDGRLSRQLGHLLFPVSDAPFLDRAVSTIGCVTGAAAAMERKKAVLTHLAITDSRSAGCDLSWRPRALATNLDTGGRVSVVQPWDIRNSPVISDFAQSRDRRSAFKVA